MGTSIFWEPVYGMSTPTQLLRDRLSSVMNKVSTVRERKTDISDRPSAFLKELMKGNTMWNKRMKQLTKKDKEIIPTYETSFEVTNHVVQLTILKLPYQMLTQLSKYRCLPWLPCKLFFISVVVIAISFSRCSNMSFNFPWRTTDVTFPWIMRNLLPTFRLIRCSEGPCGWCSDDQIACRCDGQIARRCCSDGQIACQPWRSEDLCIACHHRLSEDWCIAEHWGFGCQCMACHIVGKGPGK